MRNYGAYSVKTDYTKELAVRILLAAAARYESLLPSATKLRKLCFYRRVSFRRGLSASVHAKIPHPPRSRPPGNRPPRADTPSPPTADTHTHPEQTPPSPRERRPLLRTVRILLECILVLQSFCIHSKFDRKNYLSAERKKTFDHF